MAFRDKTGAALKDLLESQGDDGAVEVLRQGFENKNFSPNDFSLKEIWIACQEAAGLSTNVHEAIASGSFPKITGELINSRIISAYDAISTIGDQLCTTVPSNVQQETVAGFTDAEGPEEVGENNEYKDSTFTEKYVTGRNKKFGRLISVTEEMIYFDKTGQILERARRIGQKAAQYRERLIVRGVQDLDSNVYQPSGTAEAFFSAAKLNLISSNPFGESGLEEVTKKAEQMKDDSIGSGGAGDQDFIYIDTDNLTVLIPAALKLEAWQMANSVLTPESNENAKNYWKGRFNPLSSPFVSAQSATTWYAGNPKEDFWWTEVWPLQTMSQAAGHDDAFKKDIKSRHKVRFYGNIMAVTCNHWFKCT